MILGCPQSRSPASGHRRLWSLGFGFFEPGEKRGRAGQPRAAVPLHVGAVQPLAPSSTWSSATPRRGSPPPAKAESSAGGTTALGQPPASSCSPDFQSQGRTKAKRGLPPGDPQRVLGRGQEPWGRLSPRCNRDRRREEPAPPAPCQDHVQQTQRSGSAGASVAGSGPFYPKFHKNEAGKQLWRQRAACSTAPAPCQGTASSGSLGPRI